MRLRTYRPRTFELFISQALPFLKLLPNFVPRICRYTPGLMQVLLNLFMSKRIIYPLFAATLLLLLHMGCQKELKIDLTQTEIPQTVSASVTGRVVDENNIPV